MAANKWFAELLDEGIYSVAKRQGKRISGVELEIAEATGYQPATVQYWRRGNIPKEPEYVEFLVRYCVKSGRVDRAWAQSFLTQASYPDRKHLLEEVYPNHPQSTIFISYIGTADPEQRLVTYLREFLTAQGYVVFHPDNSTHTSDTWLEEIDRQIKSSGLLVVLLSANSANSEMMQNLISRAHTYRRLQGWPYILPVLAAYEGPLPYLVSTFLHPREYIVWDNEADDKRVAQQILEATEGHFPPQEPIQVQYVAEISDEETLRQPPPQIDPRLLDVPGGVVRPYDPFYIKRDADADLELQMARSSTISTIRAPRQTGKSSLLVRGLRHARENGKKVISLDMQSVDSDDLASSERFLHFLSTFIVRKLRLDLEEVEKGWRGSLSPNQKMTYLLEDYILPESDGPIVLALDEADRLLMTDFSQDFFSLVRSWYNKAGVDEEWNKLNILLVISTEPYLLIPDASQSPFNVGLKLYLDDFDVEQVRDLNRRHGSPVEESDLPQLMALLNGHPYLTRKALYTLVTKEWRWAHLVRFATSDPGPFSDHLRYHYWLLRNEEDLKEALKEVISHNRCTDEDAFFRLYRAGLVKGNSEDCKCRCDLFRSYFEDKL